MYNSPTYILTYLPYFRHLHTYLGKLSHRQSALVVCETNCHLLVIMSIESGRCRNGTGSSFITAPSLPCSADEHTTRMILDAHQTFIHLCGKLKMTTSRDAFLTSLCKACLPPKYAMSFITQRGGSKATVPPSPRHEGTWSCSINSRWL